MNDYSEFDGIVIALAYPEEFVSMIPVWYKKPLEWLGMVHDGKISAGHSAMMLIDKKSGELHYADFGRYISPFGYGRTRTKITDPDVSFEFQVELGAKNEVVNKEEILQHIFNSPQKTHGGNVMYASFNEAIDYNDCRKFIDEMNNKGSIIYDPFKKGASNCSRFVFDSILAGMTDDRSKRKLRRGSLITASPLGNVFYGTDEETYVIKDGEMDIFRDKSMYTIAKHLFRKPTEEVSENINYKPTADMTLLTGLGDQSYFKFTDISKKEDGVVKASRTDIHGKVIFDHWYKFEQSGFTFDEDYKFVHDCNAAWMTIIQHGKEYRIVRIGEQQV